MRSITLPLTLLAALAFSSPALGQKSATKKGEAKKSDDTKAGEAKKDATTAEDKAAAAERAEPRADGEPKTAPETVEPPAETWDIANVDEVPGRRYMFVGARYRGNVIPAFVLHLFLDEGKTVYTNMVGIEFDLRKDGFSLIPALSYHELGTGDLLFKQKNTKDIAGNYSLVNSGMKVVYATVDLLWSAKLSKNLEFEYGAGFGLGAVFGDLENSWVREDPNGQLAADTGKRYSRCDAVLPANSGCNRADHQNSAIDKVNGYKEPSWFEGGSKPALFPWIAVPQLGLRIKPIKNFVARVGIGFALTGFWFGLNAQYGLEQKRP